MCCRKFPSGTTWPLQSGNPRHADAAPVFAVSAPNSTVTNPRARAHSPAREGGAIRSPLATTISVESRSIAVPRCRITVQGGSASFTVTAPSPTCTASNASAARRAGGAGGRHREARAPALDGDPAPRHGDAAARDPDRRREGGSNSPALTGGAMGSGPRICDPAARRADRDHRRGVGVPRVPAVQRAGRARWELPAAHPLDASAARVHPVWLYAVVGSTHPEPRRVVRAAHHSV